MRSFPSLRFKTLQVGLHFLISFHILQHRLGYQLISQSIRVPAISLQVNFAERFDRAVNGLACVGSVYLESPDMRHVQAFPFSLPAAVRIDIKPRGSR